MDSHHKDYDMLGSRYFGPGLPGPLGLGPWDLVQEHGLMLRLGV